MSFCGYENGIITITELSGKTLFKAAGVYLLRYEDAKQGKIIKVCKQ